MEPDYDFDWDITVSKHYVEAVREAEYETTQRTDAVEVALPALRRMVEDGDLKIDIDNVIRQALTRADQAHGKRADKLVNETSEGRHPLVEVSENLDTVVTLGKGERKLWQYVGQEDLIRMDELRHENVRNAKESYEKNWKPGFDKCFSVLRNYPTIGEAVADDAFSDLADE